MTHATAPSMKTKPQKRHKYIVIRDWLSEQIASGAFARGEQMPSEHELMQRFEVSRVTARQALTDLRNKGLIEAHHGKGYFVSRFTATSNLERLQSFGEMMAPLGIETCSDIIELSEVRADQETATSLKLSFGSPLTRLVRTRKAGGRTVALTINHLPVALGRRVMCPDLGNQDLYRLMEDRLKIELAYADTILDTIKVNEIIGPFIGAKLDESVIRIQRLTFDSSGTPLIHETTYSPLETIKFQVRVPRW